MPADNNILCIAIVDNFYCHTYWKKCLCHHSEIFIRHLKVDHFEGFVNQRSNITNFMINKQVGVIFNKKLKCAYINMALNKPST